MTPMDAFARWVSLRSNQNAVLIALGIAAVVLLWLAGDYSPIPALQP